jgi:hypothetical protein
MISQLYISFTNFIYVRLTQVIWINNGLTSISNLAKNSGDYLASLYKNIEPTKPIVIDCKGVNEVIDHSWDEFFKCINSKKRCIVFINCSPLDAKIALVYKEFCQESEIITNDWKITINQSKWELTKSSLIEIDTKILDDIKTYILQSFCPYDGTIMKFLPSTPFYANGEYNATKLFMNRLAFTTISIYLSDFIEQKISEYHIGKNYRLPLKFLSVSLRSAPFAAAVSQLLNYPLQTIEYLGPQRNPTISKTNNVKEKFEYLYIGDFSFAGTEIRITQVYSSFHNSKMEHAFVIGSLFNSNRFSDFKLHSLINLHELNKAADYKLFI